MKLSNSSFLCLDIGTYGVRGLAHCIKDAKIVHSAIYFVKSSDTIFALKHVIDELENELNTRFTSAFITGNFGDMNFCTFKDTISWRDEHKISDLDLRHQIAKIPIQQNFYAIHIVPVFYGTPNKKDIQNTPIGQVDTSLKSIFSVISYEKERTKQISDILRRAHLQASGFFDSSFLQNTIYRKNKEKVLFLDLGNEFTTVSIWTWRGPLYIKKIKFGQQDITNTISSELKINKKDVNTLKISVCNATPNEMDRFTPADSSEKYASFSRADINDVFIPNLQKLIDAVVKESEKYIKQYKPEKIILTGGGSSINNINSFIENTFNIPVTNLGDNASLNALSEYIWMSHLPERKAFLQRQKNMENFLKKITKIFKRKKTKPKKRFIPIMPSTLCFDMNDLTTYTMFASAGIRMIHVDIMDGLYVDKIAGSIKELSEIRKKTKSYLHVHLMAEAPSVLARDAINAGADTVIISPNTSGVKEAIHIVKSAHKRCGIALNPDSNIEILKEVLPDIDEVMVMAVKPGAAGQPFDEHAIQRIKILNNTRRIHGLRYLISVDGGINPETAKQCWDAGADLLVSGSYLAKAPDFPLAVKSLLKR